MKTYHAIMKAFRSAHSQDERQDDVLVERVEDDLAQAPVVPVAVNQHEPPQKPELRNGKVGVVDGLAPLLAADAHTDLMHEKRASTR